MSEIDGRALGGTGDHKKTDVDDRDLMAVDVDGPTHVVECERNMGETRWDCELDGRGASFPGEPLVFDDVEIRDPDQLNREVDDDEVKFIWKYDRGGDCEIERTPYRDPDVDRTLRCRS